MSRELGAIRHTHPAGYRSGQWARVVAVVPAIDRDCYLVEFPDGATDLWPLDDPDEPYEFAETVRTALSAACEALEELCTEHALSLVADDIARWRAL